MSILNLEDGHLPAQLNLTSRISDRICDAPAAPTQAAQLRKRSGDRRGSQEGATSCPRRRAGAITGLLTPDRLRAHGHGRGRGLRGKCGACARVLAGGAARSSRMRGRAASRSVSATPEASTAAAACNSGARWRARRYGGQQRAQERSALQNVKGACYAVKCNR